MTLKASGQKANSSRATLPFKSAVFRNGLIVVLIPGLLGSFLIILLNFLWLSTADESSQEQSYAEFLMNFGLCTCALKNYCYDMMSSQNLNIPGHSLRVENDRKAFYQQFDVLMRTPVPEKLRLAGDIDAFAQFKKSALNMVRDAENLSPSQSVQPFNDNVGRLLRFRKLMLRGLMIAEDQEKAIDGAQKILKEERQHLSEVITSSKVILFFGMFLTAALALGFMYYFATGLVVRLKFLEKKAENLPALEAPDASQKIDDEFAYLENVFRQSAQQLRDANDERQAIAQMLAHDMRSPIMATQIYVDLLQEVNADSMSAETKDSCNSIKRNLTNVHDFVSDLLVAEKLECEPIELKLADVQINDCIEAAVKAYEDDARSKRVGIIYHCPKTTVHADSERIVEVLKNYIFNALRFAPVDTKILITGTTSASNVKISFHDDGRPVVRNEVEYLYDPFRETPPSIVNGNGESKTDSTLGGSESISALGMNLRIGKLLVDAHGGTTGGATKSVDGREFWFSLPLSSPNNEDLTRERSPDDSEEQPGLALEDLLSSSNFRNCILISLTALVLQVGWLIWLDNRFNAAQALAKQAAVQSDTICAVNKLWNRIFYANSATAFYLTGGDAGSKASAARNIEEAREQVAMLNVFLSKGSRPMDDWRRVRSFLMYQLTLLQNMSQRVEGEHAGYDLGILGRLMSLSGELNINFRKLLHGELAHLVTIRHEQEQLRITFQNIIAFAIIGNLVMTVFLVWLFSKNITHRLGVLVEVAERIPRRALITQTMTGRDEIYQIYWLLCRASLNLNDAVEQRRAMMRMVAKDIGLPLTEVQRMLTQLEGKLSARIQESGARSLKSARDNINRLLELDDDLLSLEQLEEGNLQIEKEMCSLSGIIETSVSSVGGLAMKKQITIRKNCAEIQVNADRKRMVQVLVNLLSNAIKFSPKDSFIDVEGLVENGRVQLSIRDQGPGLSKEDAERIFARFYQTEEGKRQGFGLGLAICSSIVKAHDGEIFAESELGKGSTFIVLLPA